MPVEHRRRYLDRPIAWLYKVQDFNEPTEQAKDGFDLGCDRNVDATTSTLVFMRRDPICPAALWQAVQKAK